MFSPTALLSGSRDRRAFRISPSDTNYFVILFDPETEGFAHICVIEIFAVGGRTPPNSHRAAHEFFYVLHGEGVAHCDGAAFTLSKGDALLLRPGAEHVVRNIGVTKLYTLTIMMPDEEFAMLIRSGDPVEIDHEDLSILTGLVRPDS